MNKKKLEYQVTGGVILIFVGIALLLVNFISEKSDKAFSDMNLALSSNITGVEQVNLDDTDIEKVQAKKDEVEYVYEPYIAQIEIPKINVYKGFYGKNSNLNNVKINLYMMPTSSYPDVEKGNVIIAGHSGNYSNSYFKDLYQLTEDDIINIYYNDTKYIYTIKSIYLQDKTGTINIYRNIDKSTLTLITCTQDDDSHQTVYIAELINKE